jgi:hypothetical protein
MGIRSVFAGMALAIGTVFAVPAWAAVDLAVLSGSTAVATLDQPLSIGDGGIIFGSSTDSGANLNHRVFFAVAENATANISATPNELSAGGTTWFDVDGLTYQVFDANTNAAVSGVVATANVLSFAALAGGAYYVDFDGIVSGTLGGNYTGNIALTPIPGAILLLGPALAGLGYVGYRRKQTA